MQLASRIVEAAGLEAAAESFYRNDRTGGARVAPQAPVVREPCELVMLVTGARDPGAGFCARRTGWRAPGGYTVSRGVACPAA